MRQVDELLDRLVAQMEAGQRPASTDVDEPISDGKGPNTE